MKLVSEPIQGVGIKTESRVGAGKLYSNDNLKQ